MIEVKAFGSTGHSSSVAIFGAAALASMSQSRADATLELIAHRNVNHIDTAASYGDSELRLAPFLEDHRDEFFLATKTGARTGSGARAGLDQSLRRLGVDQVDMIQLHNLVEEDEWITAFSAGGAVEALFKARDEGLCRFVGVTGHGLRIPAMHLRSLTEAPFASVLVPWNHALAQIESYRRDFDLLRQTCTQRNVAIQTIKSIARRRWPDPAQPHFSWYEPLEDAAALTRSVQFVIADRQLFLNTSSDARLLGATLDAVDNFTGIAPDEMQLASDRLDLDIRPLFDGDRTERI